MRMALIAQVGWEAFFNHVKTQPLQKVPQTHTQTHTPTHTHTNTQTHTHTRVFLSLVPVQYGTVHYVLCLQRLHKSQ